MWPLTGGVSWTGRHCFHERMREGRYSAAFLPILAAAWSQSVPVPDTGAIVVAGHKHGRASMGRAAVGIGPVVGLAHGQVRDGATSFHGHVLAGRIGVARIAPPGTGVDSEKLEQRPVGWSSKNSQCAKVC